MWRWLSVCSSSLSSHIHLLRQRDYHSRFDTSFNVVPIIFKISS